MPKSKKTRPSSTPGRSKGQNCQRSILKNYYSKDARAYKKDRALWLAANEEVSNMKGNIATSEVQAHKRGEYFH